ncbi:type III secretion system outer membrane ring subunit SctC [Granulosicoccus antarcticus]|uniref:Type III secretion system outer membrane protein SpiA n=1 Tax=Granulosicoccus antarcticus IMCC3135 TaxID=1192854 RepID=A0A2Z2NL20_9GAMM|nr:type III secretion system outer membrane ring subunit SctC [Granulosicoccus antarcticus]ASJ70498.1 Type III secretion system outer membrane protein SpiA [Granulosicoccus antarcticus IMCC3135]
MNALSSISRPLRTVFGSSLLSVLLLAPLANAADVPGLEKAVLINAREQPIDLFLGELFGQLGVPTRVSENVIGSVNGDFRKDARDVFKDISSSFQLSVYYDGAVAYIYPSNEIVHKVLYMPNSSAKAIERSARKLSLVDQYNTLSVADVGLVVTGAQRFVEQVEGLSEAIRKAKGTAAPAPVTHDTYRTFQLRYAWAADVSLDIGKSTVVVPGVASLIRSLIEPGALGATSAGAGLASDPSTLEGLRGKGLKGVSNQATQGGKQQAGRAVAANDNGSTSSTRIVADALSNSVIIRDRADRMGSYEELIRSLDKEPKMIEIEATIIDLDTDKLRELGINWRSQGSDGEALVSDGTLTDQFLQSDATGAGGFISLVLGSQQQFIARIKALETQGAARIVSKPHVMTLSNVEALLDTTSTFFVRVEGQEEVDLFDVSVGTTLRVTPHVYERDGRSQIKLRVNIQDGSTSDQEVDRIPVVENSTITTQAIVDVGQSLLIGGLVRESKSNGTSRVPVLGSIPILGALFRSQTKSSTRKERMFLITPRVTNSDFAGKRYEAPIFSGNEADIIQSAPARLDVTRKALSQLDEVYPAQSVLPRGSELATDNAVRADKFYPVLQPGVEQAPAAVPAQPRTLRDRLPPRQDTVEAEEGMQKVALQDDIQLPAQSAPAIETTAELIENGGDDGWQIVPSVPTVKIQSSGSAATISKASPSTKRSVPVDDDGWQEVTQ